MLTKIVRGHRIPDDELQKYSEYQIIKRFKRAIKERNIHAIILQPQLNEKVLPQLIISLKKDRFYLSKYLTIVPFKTSRFLILLIIIGVITISLISLFDGFGLPEILFPIPWISLFFLAILSNFSEINIEFYQVIAIVTAIAYPSLIALLAVNRRILHPIIQFLFFSGISSKILSFVLYSLLARIFVPSNKFSWTLLPLTIVLFNIL